MQAPDPIETILARLMPPALCQDCQLEIESMIDDLAETLPAKVREISWLTRSLIGGGIAAAIGAMCAIFPMAQDPLKPRLAMTSTPEFVLVSKSDRVEAVTDEGWQEDMDGSAVYAVTLSAVEENNLRDEESGMVVQVSEPREEILLMPISAF